MLTKIQQQLLVLLNEIDRICRENGIKYYLAGGCEIGAVRNGGFLPWDDDADIMMPREDAERLSSLADKFPENRILLRRKSNENDYPNFHWRYIDTSTTTYMRSTYFFDAPAGQFIDIFILHPVKVTDDNRSDIEKWHKLYKDFFIIQYFVDTRHDEDFFKELNELKEEEDKKGFEYVEKKFTDKLYSQDGDDCNYYLVGTPGLEFVMFPICLYDPVRYIDFEDTRLMVAGKVEELILYGYGPRWFDIPVQAERDSHEFLSDLEMPYTIYKEEIDRSVDKKEYFDFYNNRKKSLIKWMPDRNYVNSKTYLLLSHIERIKIEKKIKEENIDLKSLIDNRDIRKLEALFSGYYRIQFARFKYYNLFFDINDKWLYAAMIPMVYKGEFDKVIRVLDLRSQLKMDKLPLNLKHLKQFMEDVAAMLADIYIYKDQKSARRLVDKNIVRWKWQINLIRSDIRLMISEGKPDDGIEKKLKDALDQYPRDGELLKYYGDLELSRKNDQKALFYYRKSLPLIRNGFVKKEAKHLLEKLENET